MGNRGTTKNNATSRPPDDSGALGSSVTTSLEQMSESQYKSLESHLPGLTDAGSQTPLPYTRVSSSEHGVDIADANRDTAQAWAEAREAYEKTLRGFFSPYHSTTHSHEKLMMEGKKMYDIYRRLFDSIKSLNPGETLTISEEIAPSLDTFIKESQNSRLSSDKEVQVDSLAGAANLGVLYARIPDELNKERTDMDNRFFSTLSSLADPKLSATQVNALDLLKEVDEWYTKVTNYLAIKRGGETVSPYLSPSRAESPLGRFKRSLSLSGRRPSLRP